jgi:hypothetical protein
MQLFRNVEKRLLSCLQLRGGRNSRHEQLYCGQREQLHGEERKAVTATAARGGVHPGEEGGLL